MNQKNKASKHASELQYKKIYLNLDQTSKLGSSSNCKTLDDWSITANCGSAAASLVEALEESNRQHGGLGLETAGGQRTMGDGQGRSQLELWAYETSDAKLTFSEKLEKRYWEG